MVTSILKLAKGDAVRDSRSFGEVVGFTRDGVVIGWDTGVLSNYTDGQLRAGNIVKVTPADALRPVK